MSIVADVRLLNSGLMSLLSALRDLRFASPDVEFLPKHPSRSAVCAAEIGEAGREGLQNLACGWQAPTLETFQTYLGRARFYILRGPVPRQKAL